MLRDRQPEWMDQLDLPQEEHLSALVGLDRLNRFTQIAKLMFSPIEEIARLRPGKTIRVLDIASGSGDIPVQWAVKAKKLELQLEVTTLDVNPRSIREQLSRAEHAEVSIQTITRDCIADGLVGEYDIVTNSLFMHHLDPADAVDLLRSMMTVAKRRVILCDLERSRLNLALVSAGAHLMSRSPVVHHDAKHSVRGAFTRDELAEFVHQASGHAIPVHRVFPCRMMAVIDQQSKPDHLQPGPKPALLELATP